MQRRNFIKTTFLFLTSTQIFSGNMLSSGMFVKSNFKFIYANLKLKNEFYKFLKHVFNLYPENQFHLLINDTAIQKKLTQVLPCPRPPTLLPRAPAHWTLSTPRSNAPRSGNARPYPLIRRAGDDGIELCADSRGKQQCRRRLSHLPFNFWCVTLLSGAMARKWNELIVGVRRCLFIKRRL